MSRTVTDPTGRGTVDVMSTEEYARRQAEQTRLHDTTGLERKAEMAGVWDGDGLASKASYDTSDVALVNDVFGPELFIQYNREHKFLNVLPKVDRSGEVNTINQVQPKNFRVRYNPVALQTHSEGGTVPDGETADHFEVSADVKRSITVLEESDLLGIEAAIEDAVSMDDFEELRELDFNFAIDRDALAATPASGNQGYAARNEVTELFRLVSSQAEEANAGDESGTAYTDGDLDVYNIDRSTHGFYDSFVDFDAAGDRQLNRDLLDSFLRGLQDFGNGDPYQNGVFLTGTGTARVMSDLMADRGGTVQHIQDVDASTELINDAETLRGYSATTTYSHYDGIPIVANKTAPATGSLSDIILLNLGTTSQGEPRICLEDYTGGTYTEVSGRDSAQGFLSTGSFENRMLLKRDHEVKMVDAASHGKLRDITE